MSGSVPKKSILSTTTGGGGTTKMGTGPRTTTTQGMRTTRVSVATSKKSTYIMTPSSDKSSTVRFPLPIYDEAGVDVTPLPLMSFDATQARIQSMGEGSVSSPTDVLSQLSIGTASAFGGGPFSRSVFTQSFDTVESTDEEAQGVGSTWAEIRQKRAEVKEILTEADLSKEIVITLVETDTLWFLNMPTVCMAIDTEEAKEVVLDNALYVKLCKSRIGNDLYTQRDMNTFNQAPKFKAVQTDTIGYADIGVVCTNWDMYDTFAALETEEEEDEDEIQGETVNKEEGSQQPSSKPESESRHTSRRDGNVSGVRHTSQTSSSGRVRISNVGPKTSMKESQDTITSSTMDSVLFPSNETGLTSVLSDASSVDEGRIMKSESLKKDLFVMERVINLNTYQPKQAVYRGFPVLSDVDNDRRVNVITVDDMGPNLDRLWSYVCPLTKGRNVSCLAWNKVNPDLVAVGYGQFEFTAQKSGLICCWCLKNPEYPERIFTAKHGVLALDFSEIHPNILAAGFYDGGVAIYNVRNTADEPLQDSHDSQGKHLSPVWQIQWVEKEKETGLDKNEVLISISTDGHVMQWSIRKGFDCFDIMRLKRTWTRMEGKKQDGASEKKEEAIISRYAGGFCFDFDPRDSNIYLAGTDEGYIHKCSCSYNEQYLETYCAHTGPVYRVRWSPFVSDIFITCSADWSLCLWHQERATPILTFHSSTKQVHDLCWSPRCSTVFACVNEGCVEVWDLAQSTLDPVISVCPTYVVKLTSVTFGNNTECILVGDSEGQVTVYELRCMPPPPPREEQGEKLSNVIRACLASQMCSLTMEKSDDQYEAELNELVQQVELQDEDADAIE